jgi:hypothetical protein
VTLARLERQELARRRQDLAACERELAAALESLETLDSGAATEMALAWTLPGGARLGSAFHDGVCLRRAVLRERIGCLGARRNEARRDIREQAEKLKRISTLAERASRREEKEAARRETAALDEQAVLRHGYGPGLDGLPQNSGASLTRRPSRPS